MAITPGPRVLPPLCGKCGVIVAVCLSMAAADGATRSMATAAEAQDSVAVDGHVSFRHSLDFGISEQPYVSSSNHLNSPTGIAARDNLLLIAEGPGRRILRFTNAGDFRGQVGRAGLTQGIAGIEVGYIADITVDSDGNMWVADADRSVVVGLRPDGQLFRIIGEAGGSSTDHGRFASPVSVAVDDEGNVFVSDGAYPTADIGNHRIEIFDQDGRYVSTIGQTGMAGSSPNQLHAPRQITLDDAHRLYVTDSGNHRVQVYDVSDPRSPLLTATYGGPGPGRDDSHFDQPSGIAVDRTFLYVADAANCRVQVLRRMDGRFWKRLGGQCGDDGDALRWPVDVAVDGNGHIHVVDHLSMRVVTYDNRFGWLRQQGAPGRPYITGDVQFNAPSAVARTPQAETMIVELRGHRLVKLNALGLPEWTRGEAGVPGSDAAHFSAPRDVEVAPDGTVWVADAGNHRIQEYGSDGTYLKTIGLSPHGGLVASCPDDLAITSDARVLVAESCNHRILILDRNGAPLGELGRAGQPGSDNMSLRAPEGVSVGVDGKVYVADTGNHRVQVFDALGRVVATMGTGAGGKGFGAFDHPRRVVVDVDGRIYVSDAANHRVQVLAADGGYLTTIGGLAGETKGQLRGPMGVFVDSLGGLWIADTENHRVHRFVPGVPGWRQSNVNGFGDPSRQSATSLASFAGTLYVGVRTDIGTAELWRMLSDGTWEAVTGGFANSENTGVSHVDVFRDALYVLTENPSAGAEVWRTADGSAWTRVAAGGFGSVQNNAIVSLQEIKGHVCVGTHSTASTNRSEIWCSPDGSAGTWSLRVRAGTDGRAASRSFTSFAQHQGAYFVGTANAPAGGTVWRSDDGMDWKQVTADGFGARRNVAVSALAVFTGSLYAATTAVETEGVGSEIWRCERCEGDDWERVAQAGIGDDAPFGPAALAVFAETEEFSYLYAAIGGPQGLQVWRSANGTDWETLSVDGLGDSLNQSVAGDAALMGFHDRLYLATENAGHGAEVWSTGGTRLEDPLHGSVPEIVPSRRPVGGPIRYEKAYQFPGKWPAPEGVVPNDAIGDVAAMAVADDGSVFLLDATVNRLAHLNPDGTWGRPFGDDGDASQRISAGTDLAVDSAAQRIYVADYGARRVLVYDFEGRYVATWPDIAAWRLDISSTSSRNVWIFDRERAGVFVYDAQGRELRQAPEWRTCGNCRLLDFALGLNDEYFRYEILDGDTSILSSTGLDTGRTAPEFRYNVTDPEMRMAVIGRGKVIAQGGVYGGSGRESVAKKSSRLGIVDIHHYGFNLRTSTLYGLGTHDPDEDDDRNPTSPAIIQYAKDDMRIISNILIGRRLPVLITERLSAPERISTTPDGDVVVGDANGVMLWARDGESRTLLGSSLHRDERDAFTAYPSLSVGEGRNHRVMLVGYRDVGNLIFRPGHVPSYQRQLAVAYGDTVDERVCRDGLCLGQISLRSIWKTTLFRWARRKPQDLRQVVRAVAHDAARPQLLVLRTYPVDPLGRVVRTVLSSLRLDGYGRSTDVQLDGLPIDVDSSHDGLIYVLDARGPSLLVLNASGEPLVRMPAPADAFKVAAGKRGKAYVLTRGGQVVRMDPDGGVRARFDARPRLDVPWTAMMDLAVDERDYVYVIDQHTNQVTVFAPHDFELGGDPAMPCPILQDKIASPADIPLGASTNVTLSLSGTCGPYGAPADIVLGIDTGSSGFARDQAVIARTVLDLVDFERHRVALIAYYGEARLIEPLTRDRQRLVRGLEDLATDGRAPVIYQALLRAREQFAMSGHRRRVLVLIEPWFARFDQFGGLAISLAAEMRKEGVTIISINPDGPRDAAGNLTDAKLIAWNLFEDWYDWSLEHVLQLAETMLPHSQPNVLIRSGVLSDIIPSNMRYVADSARPAAAWDDRTRMLTWTISNTLPTVPLTFTYTLEPQSAGRWPTNVEAFAQFEDGVGGMQRLVFPVPNVRVYGFETATPPATATATPTAVPPSPTPTATPEQRLIYLPVLVREKCQPGEHHADVVLVIDTSASMRGEPLAGAQTAALAMLNILDLPRDQVALVSFDSAGRVESPLSGDRGAVEAALSGLTTRQGTRIATGLELALSELRSDRRRQRNTAVIVLLTDGLGEEHERAVSVAVEARTEGVRVFAVGLGSAVDFEVLARIAGSPNAAYLAPSTSELEAIYRGVAGVIPCPAEAYWGGR